MDTDPGAPADSTLDEQRPKGTPEQQLASFGPDSAEAPEPEEPEDEKNATAEAERPVRVTESAAATPSTQTPREIGPDSAAAPVSPPASDRNATTSAQVKTSTAPQSPTALDPKPQSQPSSPVAQFPPQDDQRPQGAAPINAATMAVGALTGAFRRPETRSQPPTPAAPADPRPSAPQSLLNRFAVKNILDTLRGTAGPNRRRATRLHTLPGRSRRDRLDQHHASADDKRRGLAGRAPGQADHFHRRTHAAAA